VSKGQKILLLVEGESLEVDLLNKVFEKYNLLMKFVIYPYNTNIYELYERMFKGNEQDLDSMDLLRILKEKDPDVKLLDEDFSDILLIFDYEPQDNRFQPDRIQLMLNYFNESTDKGKLYINYPMVESYKHLKSIPDNEYKERKVSFDIIAQGKYRELVGSEGKKYTDIKKYTKDLFNNIIIHNIKKANYIINKKYDIEDLKNTYFSIEFIDILKAQNHLLSDKKLIYVLNTCLFFICDYKMDLIIGG
jgi:hypothetical protein